MPRKRLAGDQQSSTTSTATTTGKNKEKPKHGRGVVVQNEEIATEELLNPTQNLVVDDERMEIDEENLENAATATTTGNDSRMETDDGLGAEGLDGFLQEYATTLGTIVVPEPPPPVQSFDGTGPRLLITEIVNENFKSYYGRHRLGPFHKNFTSIVGPNGSGKSNVIDSLLFVFGYRAQRIRSKNMSVLIHNSEHHPNVNYCSVEVHFVKIIDKTQDKYDTVAGSEFVISRTAFKNNQSDYYINKKKCQFKDVAARLRQNGIDIDHNRFLILQGEVEQISLMKPKAQTEGEEGMLEYLEDIIGSSRLKAPLDILQKNMDELNEMRNDKAQRVKNVEDEKAELEGPKNEAVAYLELENRITRNSNLLFQRYVLESSDNCATIEGQRDEIKKDKDTTEGEMKQIRDEIKGRQSNFNGLKKKHDDLQKEIDKQTAIFKGLDKEDTKLREDLKHCKGKTAALEGQRDAEKKKLHNFQMQPEKCQREVNEMQAKLKELEQRKKDAEDRLQHGMSRLQGETQACQDEKRTFEEELIARQAGVTQAGQKMKLAKDELELCLSAQTRERTKLEELKANLERVKKALEDSEKNIVEAEKSLPEMEKEFERLAGRIRETSAEERELVEQIRDKSSRLGTATAAAQSNGNRSRVLDALFTQQRQGRLKGIFGRLGDLGAIDEKYDVAISTACRPLDNVVVDTIDTATKCVEYLTRNQIGSATFIGLDKMRQWEGKMRQRITTPENVPRLFDLLRVEDEKFLPAFYFAMRDTLVANDLDQATRVAYQGGGRAKFRVVTLAGELIDTSGTMSGGGSRPNRGRMGRSVGNTPNQDEMTPEELKRLETELTTQRARFDEIRTARMRAEADREKLGIDLQKMKTDLNRWKMDAKAFIEQRQALESQVTNQERILANTVPDEAQKKRLEAQVKKFTKEFETINAVSQEIKEKVLKVDDAIREITEKCIGGARKEIDAIRRQTEDTERMINKSKVAEKTAQRNIRNSEEKIAAFEQDIVTNTSQIEKVTSRLKELENLAYDAEKIKEAAEKEAKSFEADLRKAKESVGEFEERMQELEKVLMELQGKIDHFESTLKELVKKKTHWEKELKKLQLHDIRRMCGLPPLDQVEQQEAQAAAPPATQPTDGDPNAKEKISKKKKKKARRPRRGEDDAEGEENEEEEDDDENDGSMADDESEPMDVDDEQREAGRPKAKKQAFDLGDDDNSIQLKTYEAEYLRNLDPQRLVVHLTAMEEELQNRTSNLDVLDEYRKKEEKYQRCNRELNDVTKMRDIYRDRYEEIRKTRLNEFMDGFIIISTKLKEMYQMITLGGDADLELVDTMDPFTEGISFSVRPPKKSWKAIANLSGGEKTLSSLSLVFALHHYKPTPLYVMDEIDAALDFKNVSIVAHYIKERTKNAQFVIISLRNNMFELADRLVGIYKTFHCTKTAVIDPRRICMPPPKKRESTSTKPAAAGGPSMEGGDGAEAATTTVDGKPIKQEKPVLRDRSSDDNLPSDGQHSPLKKSMSVVDQENEKAATLLSAMIGGSWAMFEGQTEVVELTASNFNTKVVQSDSVWIVEFYAPWCGHCQSFAPEYSKAAKVLKGMVKVGAVDMDKHQSVGGPYNVRGFPTVKIFGADKSNPVDFQGSRTAQALIDKALDEVKKTAQSRLSGKTTSGGGGGGGGGKKESKGGDEKDVIELTDSNFEDKVLKSEEMWLVEFFAPWCGHCKSLAPHWASAATQLKGKVKVAAVDATIHTVMAGRFGIRGFPTIKMFPAGKKNMDEVVDYDGGRTSDDIVRWASDKLADSTPPPEIHQLTSEKVLKDSCEKHQLCIVSFLPHILDCQSKCRNKYLQTLRELAEKYKKNMWGWVWSEAAAQPTLEDAVAVGGFGYPAMAAVNSRKMKYSVLKGSFSFDGINEFLRELSYGRGSTAPVKGAELPKITSQEPWNGKDAEPPKDEEIDLSDVDLGKEEL